jgi:MFS family permease
MLAGFATLTDQGVVNYALPSLATSLHASTDQVQWFLSVYSLTFGIGLVPGGRLGDAHGRRGLFLLGLGLFLAGSVVTVASPAIGFAIAGRCVQGFGAGLISAQVLGIIQDLFAGRARVAALSGYSIAASASAIIGPLTAGGVLSVAGDSAAGEAVAWRAVLTISMPFVITTGVLAALFVPRTRPVARPRGLDALGIALTAGIVLLSTVPVVSQLPRQASVGIFVLVAALVAVTFWWERRLARCGGTPLFAPALVRSGGFISGNVVALLWFGAAGAQGSIITVFLLQGYRMPGLLVACLMIPGSLARILGSSLSARMHDLFAAWALPGALAIEAAAAVVLVPVVGSPRGAWVIAVLVAVQLVMGFGSGVFEPLIRARTLSFVAPTDYGLGASFLQLTQRLSATFCIALVTGIAFAGGVDAVGPATLRAGVGVTAGLLVVALAESVRATVAAGRRSAVGRPRGRAAQILSTPLGSEQREEDLSSASSGTRTPPRVTPR